DLLTCLPALRGLRAAFPRHELVLATPAVLAPLAIWSEAVDRVLPLEELAPLPACRPEVAVNLHGCGPQSHRALLASGASRMLWFQNQEVPMSAGAPH